MKTRRPLTALALAAALIGSTATTAAARPEPVKPRIQIALLLDTSGSMSGLIDQARTQLWKVVNEFATAKRDGLSPTLEVALYEYGKASIPASEGYIRMITPLTTDLDKVSEELFALTTNGGDEFCGQVIRKAAQGLRWSQNMRDLKMIFIAGNEPFTQGPVDYRTAVKEAIAKGITVSTIHCGAEAEGLASGWKDGAMLADGSFMNIDHNRRVAHITAPQDDELARLGRELNKTYIGYGKRGQVAMARQEAQDSNAAKSAGSMQARAVTKSSGYYDNSGWDLVDAKKKGKLDLAKVAKDELPAEMREMSVKEREAHVAKMDAKRTELQAKIRTLNAARTKYVSAKQAELATKGGKETLDGAMIREMKRQAKKKAFSL
jgi:hypothetical protein